MGVITSKKGSIARPGAACREAGPVREQGVSGVSIEPGVDEDEDELVRSAVAGDKQAFMVLVRRHHDQLRGLAYAMTGSATAMDDVLQDAYLKAFRAIGDFRGTARFTTWIYRIVHNAAIDHMRAQARSAASEEPLLAASMSGHSDDVVRRIAIDQALAALPEAQRAAVLLVDGEGFDYRSAGEVLGVPEGTVASRVHAARAALRRSLSDLKEEK
jgi:RNA polymerase sigma-70 factor (ECF subfamily)